MALIHPHINFNGNAEEAFLFYQSVFGGEFVSIVRFRDLEGPDMPIAAHEADKLMHIALTIGPNLLMGNDVPEQMGRTNEQENRSKIAITAESRDEADCLYAGLSSGATIEVPLSDSPWGSYFAMLRDKYGIEWIIDYDPKFSSQQ